METGFKDETTQYSKARASREGVDGPTGGDETLSVTTSSLIARGTLSFRRICLALSTMLTSHWSVQHDLDRRQPEAEYT